MMHDKNTIENFPYLSVIQGVLGHSPAVIAHTTALLLTQSCDHLSKMATVADMQSIRFSFTDLLDDTNLTIEQKAHVRDEASNVSQACIDAFTSEQLPTDPVPAMAKALKQMAQTYLEYAGVKTIA